MAELTRSFRYIFLDIVKFTKRSVEAQSDVVHNLNEIVKASVSEKGLEENVLYIPTGDGICLALSGELTFDIHILVALDILDKIHNYNEKQEDDMRKFKVRIGINENIDNVIEDINGRTNVAGSGINNASRIMDNADEGQILVSQAVYDILHVRERYMESFKSYNATIKHGIKIPVHQYIKEGLPGLNTDAPSSLSNKRTVYSLGKKSAYYFAHAIMNRELLIKKKRDNPLGDYISVIFLWFLSHDSYEMSKSSDFDSVTLRQPGGGKFTLEEQYDAIGLTDNWITIELSDLIEKNYIGNFHSESFEEGQHGMKCWFIINKHGQQKLKKEHPDIWQEFNLDDYVE